MAAPRAIRGALTTIRFTRRKTPGRLTGRLRCWQRPIFPGGFPPSIFGTGELNFRVRDGNGWGLTVMNTSSSFFLCEKKGSKKETASLFPPFSFTKAVDMHSFHQAAYPIFFAVFLCPGSRGTLAASFSSLRCGARRGARGKIKLITKKNHHCGSLLVPAKTYFSRQLPAKYLRHW